ncbi:DMT family transporter [uncultured Oscillibacter sp.]|jgi:drug/metabolite transporter (DMT)-like permease|uniref:DMT family transporter n=1 Tax=uncultured Oscillibacter sp. TaxID=876091 RepID=UPI002170BD42|nr:DMT family transporter [uncultured Oscillibacter sp.]MCI9553790.1 DMT family transporter [Oscillibacter sp.]
MKRLIVLLGVAGVSLSAVFVRWSTAPSLVLALYRMAFSALLLIPLALARRAEFRALRRRELCLSLLSGAFLGVHFACYFESLRWTSIAAAVVLVDTEVLFVALASVLILRKKLSRRAWTAVLLAFGGSVAVALADASGGGALRGNLFALTGSVCMAVYTMLGAVCRRSLSTTVYTSLVYLSAAGTVLAAALAGGQALTGWGPVNLLAGLGMAVFCTLLGHSVFSWGLKYLPPAFISTANLLEPVLAAVWGLLLFGERPGPLVVLGGGVILLGIAVYSREEV